MVDVSTHVEAEAAIAAARDQAVEASRIKSDFLATMSHEIRTPMNGVIGLTGLLLETQLTETQRSHAEGVRASGEALLSIINDILDFSKIEAGKLELETVDFDVASAVEAVAALVAESARAKGLELVAYCRPEVPSALRGDVGRLRQILLNFATNAIKFTESGEVVLRADVDGEPTTEQVMVRFEMSDTGVGVDPATAERLFEPFSQADASTTRRYGGTGLGLAICRRLAHAMGGTVGVDSRPGPGSTFWLHLPLAPASQPVEAPDRSPHLLSGRRVLVVDDNQTNRLVLASQLRAWNISADVTADGAQALECLRRAARSTEPYDLALLDMAMPAMDGLELAAIIASDPELSSVRLLLHSTVSIEAEVAARAGFEARLAKPVRLSSLYDALLRAVSPSGMKPAGTVALSPTAGPASKGMVLVVEDNAINQEVAKGIAAKLGFGSDVAADGVEALEALERRSYDAVLMDCHMPEMDGFAATAEIRRREAGRRHVPIIAMTAGARAEDRERCLAAGMDDYLSKPVKSHELNAVLDRWIAAAEPAACTKGPEGDGPEGVFSDGHVVLDAAQLDNLRELAAASGDVGVLSGLVERYLNDAASQVAGLNQAAERGDSPTVKELAHGLKRSSATMGASRMASACSALEQAAAVGDVARTEALRRVAFELGLAAEALRAALV
jgi:CheY-like chemotaxis protein/HPt (histidine-containing phosphotransfer) domain-containing protein